MLWQTFFQNLFGPSSASGTLFREICWPFVSSLVPFFWKTCWSFDSSQAFFFGIYVWPSTALGHLFLGKLVSHSTPLGPLFFKGSYFLRALKRKVSPLTKECFSGPRKILISLTLRIKLILWITVAIIRLNISINNCLKFVSDQISVIVVPFIRLFAKFRFAHIYATSGYMCIFDTKPKFKIKIWIPDDITSINFVRNKCQVCLVQKGYVYYV